MAKNDERKGPEKSKPAGVAVREVRARSILNASKIPGIDYSLNPYTGCAHACAYCYAVFMQRFSGHTEAWGSFVDAKVNAPELLARELPRRRPGTVGLSLVTDPYQPLEGRFRLTRQCLEILAGYPDFRVSLLTRSPLVTRDIDVLRKLPGLEAGLSVTTDDDAVRRLFEPAAPPIPARLEALRRLKEAGLATYAFVGPALAMNPERLAGLLLGKVDYILLDGLNYGWRVQDLCRRHNLGYLLQPGWKVRVGQALSRILGGAGIEVRLA